MDDMVMTKSKANLQSKVLAGARFWNDCAIWLLVFSNGGLEGGGSYDDGNHRTDHSQVSCRGFWCILYMHVGCENRP